MQLTLRRIFEANRATLGMLRVSDLTFFTLEDEWKDNKPNVSCIPSGQYVLRPHGWEPDTPFREKEVWELCNVSGRSGILIHAGNSNADTKGCILVGKSLHVTQQQSRVEDSKLAIEALRALLGQDYHTLTILDAYV